jgi:hypothetical protein
MEGLFMPTVANAARLTSRDTAIWRYCGCCGLLAALAPDTTLCESCSTAALTAYLDLKLGELADAALRGDGTRAVRLLRQIRAEASVALADDLLRRTICDRFAATGGGAR